MNFNVVTSQFWSLIVSGLALGFIYVLISLGYTMVYGVLRLINFANSEIFMVGTFATVIVSRNFYKFDQNQALATSLLTVGFSSMLSFFIQVLAGAKVHLELSLVNLVLGTFLAAFLLKWLTQRWPPDFLIKMRRITFTLVIFLALAKVFSA